MCKSCLPKFKQKLLEGKLSLSNFIQNKVKQLSMAIDFTRALLKDAEFLKPFAITLTRDNETAKDLFQETF